MQWLHVLDSPSFAIEGLVQDNLNRLSETGQAIERYKREMPVGADPTTEIDSTTGDTYTDWNGVALLDEYVFVGAGTRGVLYAAADSLPGLDSYKGRMEQASMTALDLGGDCVDLTRRGDKLYALVSTADADHVYLVELTWQNRPNGPLAESNRWQLKDYREREYTDPLPKLEFVD